VTLRPKGAQPEPAGHACGSESRDHHGQLPKGDQPGPASAPCPDLSMHTAMNAFTMKEAS